MGKADTATTSFMRQHHVFADAFNFFLYQGYPVIDPGQLRDLDPAELVMPYGADQKSEACAEVPGYPERSGQLWRTGKWLISCWGLRIRPMSTTQPR